MTRSGGSLTHYAQSFYRSQWISQCIVFDHNGIPFASFGAFRAKSSGQFLFLKAFE
jgi:hypothetical protein